MAKKNISFLYQNLIKVRFKIILPLLLLTIIPYFSFNPMYFGTIIKNTNISIGILLGFLLILLIFLITLVYVYLANKKLEPLIFSIKND
jgi:uncharacterized membrane protein (DUF485 family)